MNCSRGRRSRRSAILSHRHARGKLIRERIMRLPSLTFLALSVAAGSRFVIGNRKLIDEKAGRSVKPQIKKRRLVRGGAFVSGGNVKRNFLSLAGLAATYSPRA
jgi:hypothetical protein